MTDTTKSVYAVLFTLAAIPVCVWLEAHTMSLAWNGILRVYLPMLPALSLWAAWAVHVAAKVIVRGAVFDGRVDERETKDWYALNMIVAHAWPLLVVWLIARYTVGAA